MMITAQITTGEAASTANPFGFILKDQRWVWMGGAFTTVAGTVTVGRFQQHAFAWDEISFPNAISFVSEDDPIKSSFKIESPAAVSAGDALFWFGFQNNLPATYTVFVGKTITASGGSSNIVNPQILEALTRCTTSWHHVAHARRKILPASRSAALSVTRTTEPRLPEPRDPLEEVEWFKDAADADREGRTSKAVGILFDHFDQLLTKGDFRTVDFLLRRASTSERSLAFLMALLSITLPASVGSSVPYRRFLYNAVERRILEEGRNPDAMLGSLREWSRIDGPDTRSCQ